jgi:hypothetical protein
VRSFRRREGMKSFPAPDSFLTDFFSSRGMEKACAVPHGHVL